MRHVACSISLLEYQVDKPADCWPQIWHRPCHFEDTGWPPSWPECWSSLHQVQCWLLEEPVWNTFWFLVWNKNKLSLPDFFCARDEKDCEKNCPSHFQLLFRDCGPMRGRVILNISANEKRGNCHVAMWHDVKTNMTLDVTAITMLNYRISSLSSDMTLTMLPLS